VTAKPDQLDGAAEAWDVEYEAGRDGDGGFSVRYLAGPKRGLLVHFFAESELDALFAGYHVVLSPRLSQTRRVPRERGQWSQWEAIYTRSA